MEKIKKPFMYVNQSVGKCLICNKDIRVNDASSLTYDGWKMLAKLAKTWSSVVLPIDHQYYKHTQVHELISDRKKAFCKQHCSKNYKETFGRHSKINELIADRKTTFCK